MKWSFWVRAYIVRNFSFFGVFSMFCAKLVEIGMRSFDIGYMGHIDSKGMRTKLVFRYFNFLDILFYFGNIWVAFRP